MRMKISGWYGALTILVFVLPSCAMFEPESQIVQDAEIRRQLAALETWRMDGRVGVRSPDDSWHASLTWSHDRDVERLYISGPFGQGALHVKVKEDYIRVASSDGTVQESGHPEELLESILKVAIPVRALRYWVLGLTYPAEKFDSEYDRSGRLKKLKQSGWLTEYQSYQVQQQWSVPKKLSVENGTTKLKLVVDEWRFPDEGGRRSE